MCFCLTLSGAAKAAEAAKDKADEALIEFSDILEHPADLHLNMRYARQQIARGYVVSAANALERLVISHPERHDIRFSLAVLLYRMGNLSQSESHLRILQASTLPRQLAERVDEYLIAIAERQRRLGIDAEIALGVQFDTNRNAYPVSGQFTVLSTRRAGTGEEDADLAKLVFGGIDVSYDTERQTLRAVTLSADVFMSDQVEIDRLDLLGYAVELGAEVDWLTVQFEPHLSWIELGLGDRGYLSEVAGGLRAERRLPHLERVVGFLDGTYGYQGFNDQSIIAFADEQSGAFASIELGADWLVTAPLRIGGSFKHLEKTARTDFEAFGEDKLEARIVWVPFSRAFLATEIWTSWRDYDGPDPFISAGTTREDQEYAASATFGIGMAEILRPISESAAKALGEDTVFLLSAEYSKVDSNLPNFEYDNTSVRALISHRFSVY